MEFRKAVALKRARLTDCPCNRSLLVTDAGIALLSHRGIVHRDALFYYLTVLDRETYLAETSHHGYYSHCIGALLDHRSISSRQLNPGRC